MWEKIKGIKSKNEKGTRFSLHRMWMLYKGQPEDNKITLKKREFSESVRYTIDMQ